MAHPPVRHEFAQQLKMYALAASAAGVSLLAAQTQAEVVYTPAHERIVPNHTYPLDLNNDGIIDFKFHASFTCTSFCEYIVGALTLEPQQKNEGEGAFFQRYGQTFAYALSAGAVIGPKAKFLAGNLLMASGSNDEGPGNCWGLWVNKRNHYLGLAFKLNKQVHFGWARLTEVCLKNGENGALLTGYAYETVANRPIVAGATPIPANEGDSLPISPTSPQPLPASLGTLAIGVQGISLWRRPSD